VKKILIIDDNRDAADMLASILELKGHLALASYGPAHGLLTLKEFAPEIVFLDIGMPEMNGYQVAAKIRLDLDIQQPYLIAFTAWDDASSVAQAKRAGFDRHMTKTSTFEVLMSAIDDVTETAQGHP